MRHSKLALAFGWALALSLAPLRADATTILASSVEELTLVSEAVVYGRVVHVAPKLRDERVVTSVVIEVDEVLYGDAPRRIQLEAPAGQLGELSTRVSGADLYAQGQRVVLFAERGAGGIWRSKALSWGCFRVVDGFAIRSSEGLEFVRVDDKGRYVGVTLTPEEVAMSFEELRDRVKNAGPND